jgi:hypothetical protein
MIHAWIRKLSKRLYDDIFFHPLYSYFMISRFSLSQVLELLLFDFLHAIVERVCICTRGWYRYSTDYRYM